MKKILVPTDFSDNAQAAFFYALELAEKIDATVSVVHICHPTAHHVNEWMVTTDTELIKLSTERLEQFVQSGFSKTMEDVIVADMVDQQLILGFAAEELVALSRSGDYEMIVMGSTGASGFLDKLFGKVSSHVAERAGCPVLLIPVGTKFTEVKNIMYASDYESADESVLAKIGELANRFNAHIHLVHVEDEKNKSSQQFGHFLLEKVFQKKAPSLNFKMISVESDSVAHGLQKYAEENEIDWMVSVKPQRSFWGRLRHKSKTNELVMNPQVPMMIMH